MQVTKHKEKLHFCKNCLNHFHDEDKSEIHEEKCEKNEEVNIEMPEVEIDKETGEEIKPKIKFKNHNRSIRVPFELYADFEAVVKPINSCELSSQRSFTKQYQKHVPCGFCYHIICFDEKYTKETVICRAESKDEDVSKIFIDWLERDIKNIHEEFDFATEMIFTKKNKFEKTKKF